MTADYTIEATLGRVAAVERDGFLVVTGPLKSVPINPDDPDLYEWGSAAWTKKPVPTSKPCPSLLAYEPRLRELIECTETCPACGGDGTVPIVVEVVTPERECDGSCGLGSGHLGCASWRAWGKLSGRPHDELGPAARSLIAGPRPERSTIPARTILRGTAEAVPVLDDVNDWPTEEGASFVYVEGALIMLYTVDADADDGYEGWDLSAYGDDDGHFAGVPSPEVGDTAWILREEG